jgi:hypothetical protein
VLGNESASDVLKANGLIPTAHNANIRGIANELSVYAIP